MPKGLKLRYKGVLKWRGKPGRLEIIYDDVGGVWRGFMAVMVEKPPRRGGGKPLYIDLGVVNLATVWFEGLRQPIAFSGRAVLSDWWYHLSLSDGVVAHPMLLRRDGMMWEPKKGNE